MVLDPDDLQARLARSIHGKAPLAGFGDVTSLRVDFGHPVWREMNTPRVRALRGTVADPWKRC